MADDTNFEDFNNYLKIQNAKVRNNVQIVTAADLKQQFMLHIDIKPPSKFTPMMPRRASRTEDNTVARITVADTLLGCVLAYAGTIDDFFDIAINGYIISSIEFDYCLKPNNQLVYDADFTGEHWLVAYNKKTLNYKPVTIGKIFISEYNCKRTMRDGKPIVLAATKFYFETDTEFMFNKNDKLSPGFYKVSVSDLATPLQATNDLTINTDETIVIQKLTKSEYDKQKEVSASMLSNTSVNIPLYKHW